MANHKSSLKRARQTIVINKRNREYLSSVKTRVKSFYDALSEHKPLEDIESVYKMVQSSLAKAGQKGRIHKNNASRKISRLAATLAGYKASFKDGVQPKAEVGAKKPVKRAKKAKTALKKTAKKAKTATAAKKTVAKKAPIKKAANKKK